MTQRGGSRAGAGSGSWAVKTVSFVCKFTALPKQAQGPSPELSVPLLPLLKTEPEPLLSLGCVRTLAGREGPFPNHQARGPQVPAPPASRSPFSLRNPLPGFGGILQELLTAIELAVTCGYEGWWGTPKGASLYFLAQAPVT